MTAELAARRTAAAAVLADYRAALASAPLGTPPGREWMFRLADALGGLLDGLGQEGTAPPSRQEYIAAAAAAIQAAAIAEHDFAGWLAAALATVAAGLGSSAALVQGRPGSWEAADVLHLVRGTVGHNDEDLARYGGRVVTGGPHGTPGPVPTAAPPARTRPSVAADARGEAP